MKTFWRRFRKSRVGVVGGVMLILMIVSAIVTPVLWPHDPVTGDLRLRLRPPVWKDGGDWSHPLGCDQQGRDVLSRLLHGARVSLLVGLVVVVASAAVGTLLGLLAGYFGGWIDAVISRTVDILLAFPFMIFAIGLMAVLQPGLLNIILTLTLKGWVPFCRLVRGDALAAKGREHVEAARALGAGHRHQLFREILPIVLPSVIVLGTLTVATVILLEASLSFLGLGVQPPTPTWGGMVSEGREYLIEEWWLSTFPGLAILLTVLSVNLFGQGMRDALDPHLQE